MKQEVCCLCSAVLSSASKCCYYQSNGFTLETLAFIWELNDGCKSVMVSLRPDGNLLVLPGRHWSVLPLRECIVWSMSSRFGFSVFPYRCGGLLWFHKVVFFFFLASSLISCDIKMMWWKMRQPFLNILIIAERTVCSFSCKHYLFFYLIIFIDNFQTDHHSMSHSYFWLISRISCQLFLPTRVHVWTHPERDLGQESLVDTPRESQSNFQSETREREADAKE